MFSIARQELDLLQCCCALHRLGSVLPFSCMRRQWGAAVYTAGVCGAAPNSLGVAPVDSPAGVVPTYPEGTPYALLNNNGLTYGGTGSGESLWRVQRMGQPAWVRCRLSVRLTRRSFAVACGPDSMHAVRRWRWCSQTERVEIRP
jgi:hypothetical protein